MRRNPPRLLEFTSRSMPYFDLQSFAKVRPFLYHLTAKSNLQHIKATGKLFPASVIVAKSYSPHNLRERRVSHEAVATEHGRIVLRDQQPLHKGNIDFQDGYSFEDFVEHLNRRVFFWPGGDQGPNDYGDRHFKHYEGESPAILRIAVNSLLRSNPPAVPLFCRYNSGSPRCSQGKKSPRGPNTFLPADEFQGTPNDVVEVTFEKEIILPHDTKVGKDLSGRWRNLFSK